MGKEKLVVIGNGMAGMRTVEEILARDPGKYEITVFGAEPEPNYDRIMLSPLLAGEKSFAQIVINPLDWYRENQIELIAGEHVDWMTARGKSCAAPMAPRALTINCCWPQARIPSP